MSGSGLIYAAVLGAWAIYLLSRCLRFGGRAVAPAEGTVLRRRGGASLPTRSGVYAAVRPAPADPVAPVVKRRQADAVVPCAPVRVSAATARRRRRVLRLLILAVLFFGVAAVSGVVSPWVPGIPVLLLISYLVELRVQVRRAQAPQVRVTVAPAAVGAEAERRPLAPLRRARAEQNDNWDPWPSFDEPPVTELPGRIDDFEDGWAPRAVPLPTYVTAPKAERTPAGSPGRRIDVSAGTRWIAGADDDTQEIAVAFALTADCDPIEQAPTGAAVAVVVADGPDADEVVPEVVVAGGAGRDAAPDDASAVVEIQHKRAVGD